MNIAWPNPVVPPPQTPQVVPDRLRLYGDTVRRVIDEVLDRDPTAPFLSALVADYPRRSGKMMRPAICIAVASALGAPLADVLPSAAAIELFHNALLVHDDIEDDSEMRRGRPALHVAHGIPLAINAGDALMLMALQPLLDNAGRLGESTARKILAATQTMARQTAEGQALDLGWRESNRTDLTDADYLDMVLKKTAWLATIWPMQVGVAIGTRGIRRVDPEAVIRFGFFLGAAFQIQDDLLNLVADTAYGKERGGDLYEAKRTLMLIHVRTASLPAERRRIDDFLMLARRDRTAAMVRDIAGLMEHHGSIDHARNVAGGLAGAAVREFDAAFGHLSPSADKDFLAGLVPWIFERT